MKKISTTFIVSIFFIFTVNASGLPWKPTVLANSTHGIVASQEELATKVGVEILKQGGNAFDATIAVGYALAVTLPEAGNIGGGGFLIAYDAEAKETIALNYRENAPKNAKEDLFLDGNGNVDIHKSQFSLYAVGIPTTVDAFEKLHARYGTLPRKILLAPAIKLAKEGFPVYTDLANRLRQFAEILSISPDGRKIFFNKNGEPLKEGEILKQPELAKTLEEIAENGRDGFYKQGFADALIKDIEKYGGIITKEDLQNYQTEFVKPIFGKFKGYSIATMPPPSSGGVALVQLLDILSDYPLKEKGFHNPESIHYIVEAMNYVYAQRSEFLGDPRFYDVPLDKLLSQENINNLRNKIRLDKHQKASEINPQMLLPKKESPNTTHYSIADSKGNMVSNTYTLNSAFGNGHVVTGTGVLLNNELDDFSSKPGFPNQFGVTGGKANSIEGNKQPLSSMTPVIVFDKEGKPLLATGSTGGSRITTTVLQTLLNTLVYDMDIATALNKPKFHSQWLPDNILIEEPFVKSTNEKLIDMGHEIIQFRPMGSTQTVMVKNGKFFGASDPRRAGLAEGY